MYLSLDSESIGIIKNSIKGGMTLDQAIDRFFLLYASFMRGFGWEERILSKVYVSQSGEPEIEEGETYYPNDKETVIEIVSSDTDKARDYIYNCIYKLKQRGLITTKVVRDKNKLHTLLYLTETGNSLVESIKSSFKSDYLRQAGERGERATTTR